MAFVAYFALMAFMDIVLLVTVITFGTDLVFYFAGMAVLATHVLMLVFQGKIRFVMVKLIFTPCFCIVAVLTFFSKLPLMLIVKFMAVIAIVSQFFLVGIFIFLMTLIASNSRVRTG